MIDLTMVRPKISTIASAAPVNQNDGDIYITESWVWKNFLYQPIKLKSRAEQSNGRLRSFNWTIGSSLCKYLAIVYKLLEGHLLNKNKKSNQIVVNLQYLSACIFDWFSIAICLALCCSSFSHVHESKMTQETQDAPGHAYWPVVTRDDPNTHCLT